jgi:hypothetical protein
MLIVLLEYFHGNKSVVCAVGSFSFNCREMARSVSFTDLPEPQVNIGPEEPVLLSWREKSQDSALNRRVVRFLILELKHFIPAHIVILCPICVKQDCCSIMKLVKGVLFTTVAEWMCQVRACCWAKNTTRMFKTNGRNNCEYTGRLLGVSRDGFYSRDCCIDVNIELFATPSSDIWNGVFFNHCIARSLQ